MRSFYYYSFDENTSSDASIPGVCIYFTCPILFGNCLAIIIIDFLIFLKFTRLQLTALHINKMLLI